MTDSLIPRPNARDIPTGESTFRAVLAVAARGLRLFPVASRAKIPLVKDWRSLATTDPAALQAWSKQYPGCNWGLACGRGSGVWVLDVDGEVGETSLRSLCAGWNYDWKKTLVVKTARGKLIYHRWPEGASIKNSAGRVAPGLDVRGDGGYVLVPPSVHSSGVTYEWGGLGDETGVAPAPDWLLEIVTTPAQSSVPSPVAGGPSHILKGQRNETLISLAGAMRRRGMTAEAIQAALAAENLCRCKPPLPESEVLAIGQSVLRYAAQSLVTPLAPRRADLLTLATVQPRDVEWLWRPYLPIGMLSMLSGDPGAGKTYLALAIAASLTTGHVPYSQERCAPMNVLYMSLENDPSCVLRPRFDSLGGDPARLYLARGVISADGEKAEHSALWLSDTSALRDALERTDPRLLVIDPLQSYIGADVDAHRANETRPILDGVARLADEYRCCVLLVRHLSKARGGRAIHAGLGSIDLTGAVRTELLAGCAAEDHERRAIVQVKSNIGAYGPALGYVVNETGQFAWTGESALTAADILAPESREADRTLDEANEWLREYLASGPRTYHEVREVAAAKGFSWRTVNRAKKNAGVRSRKATFGEGWFWEISEVCQETPKIAKNASTEKLASFGEVGILQTPRPVTGEL